MTAKLAAAAEHPQSLQLRYLDTLMGIAGEKNSTIVFPLPLDLVTPFMDFVKSPRPDR